MYKIHNKKRYTYIISILIVWGIFFGLYKTNIFGANDTSGNLTIRNALQTLLRKTEKSEPIDKIFDGKTAVENLYQRSLDLAKNTEFKTAATALDQMVFFSTGGEQIDKKDILNILYNTNRTIKQSIKSMYCKDCEISQGDIKKSYDALSKGLSQCKTINTDTTEISWKEKTCVDNEINNRFGSIEKSISDVEILNQVSRGEDLFMNGSLDDSDYDLISDIQNIGNLLFQGFKAPIEILFYKMPKIPQNGGEHSYSNTPAAPETLLSLFQNIANKQDTENKNGSGITTGINKQIQKIGNAEIHILPSNQKLKDTGLNTFFTQTSTASLPGSTNKIQGNSCLSSVESENSSQETTVPTQDEITDYLSGIDTFIAGNEQNQEDTGAVNIDSTLSGMTQQEINNTIANQMDQLFDTGEVETCTQKCKNLPADEKILCEIQCLCFTISKPNFSDPRLINMNDALKLKFCMVPVKQQTVSTSKNIYSLDDMLTRIKSLFENLLNGGEMIKQQKTKEYLDNPIADFDRSKIISFNIEFNIKPIFSRKPTKAAQQEEIAKIQQAKNISPNRNKYIVIADPIQTKASKEYAATLSDADNNLQKLIQKSILTEQLTTNLGTTENQIQNEKAIKTNDILITFLQKNNEFRFTIINELQQINSLAGSLVKSFPIK